MLCPSSARLRLQIWRCVSGVYRHDGLGNSLITFPRCLHQQPSTPVGEDPGRSHRSVDKAVTNTRIPSSPSQLTDISTRFLQHLSVAEDVQKIMNLIFARWNGELDTNVIESVAKRLCYVENLAYADQPPRTEDINPQSGIYRPCMEHDGVQQFVLQSGNCVGNLKLLELVALARLYARLAVIDFFPTAWLSLSEAIVQCIPSVEKDQRTLLKFLDRQMLLIGGDKILAHDVDSAVVMAVAMAARVTGCSRRTDPDLLSKVEGVVVNSLLPVDTIGAMAVVAKLADTGYACSQNAMDAVTDQCSGSLHTYPPSLLVSLAKLYPQLDVCPRDFSEELCEALVPHLPIVSAGDLACTVVSFAHGHVVNEGFWTKAPEAFLNVLSNAATFDINSMISALCCSGYADIQPIARLLSELLARLQLACTVADVKNTVVSLSESLQAGLWLDTPHSALLSLLAGKLRESSDSVLCTTMHLCTDVLNRTRFNPGIVNSLHATVTEVRWRLVSLSTSHRLEVLSSLHSIRTCVSTPAVTDLISATVQVLMSEQCSLSAAQATTLLEVLSNTLIVADQQHLKVIMTQLFSLSDQLSFHMCMRCFQAFANLHISDTRLFDCLLQPHVDRLRGLSDRELFSFSLVLSKLSFKPRWMRQVLLQRGASLPIFRLNLHQLFLYESLAVLDCVSHEQLGMVLKNTENFIHGLKQHEELPVYQILLRLYAVVGAFRTAPPHIRLSVFRAALADHRKKAANQSLYSAVCRAVSPAADQEHAVSSLVMVYPGVLLSAAVLLDRSGQLHPWEPKLFNIADHVEEDLAEDSVKFVDSLKIRENSLTPVGFLVVPKSSCFCNHPSLAMDRLGLELELARRQCWKTVIIVEEDWNAIVSPVSEVEMVREKLKEIQATFKELPGQVSQ